MAFGQPLTQAFLADLDAQLNIKIMDLEPFPEQLWYDSMAPVLIGALEVYRERQCNSAELVEYYNILLALFDIVRELKVSSTALALQDLVIKDTS